MVSPKGIRAGAAYVELYTNNSRLVKGLKSAEQRLKAFGGSIRSIGTRLVGLGSLLAAPMAAAVGSFASAGDQLDKMAGRTGVSTNALSELGFAAEQSGQSLEVVEQSLRKMQKTIGDAFAGLTTASDAFSRIGVSLSELEGLAPEEQFERIADGLAAIADPTFRAAAAMDIFGRSGTALLPMIADGAEGIRQLREEARDLGLSIDSDQATAAAELVDAWNRIKRAAKAALFSIGSALAPALIDLLDTIKPIVVSTGRWIRDNKQLLVTFAKIAAAVVAAGVGLIVAGSLIAGAGAALGLVAATITGVGSAIAALGTFIAALLSPIGLVITGLAVLSGYLLTTSGAGGKAIAWLADKFSILKSDGVAAFRGISDALAAGDIGLAAKILWLTLKMEWQRGVNWLEEKWLGFKGAFLSIWTDAVFSLAEIMMAAWAMLQSGWTEAVAAMSSVWATFSSGAVSAWKGAQNFISKGIVRLMGLLDSSVDVEGTIKLLEEDFPRDEKQRGRDTQRRLSEIEDNRQRRQNEIQSERSGTLQTLEEDRQRQQSERQRQVSGDLKRSEQSLAQARRQWEEALAEAAAKRMDQQLESGPGRLRAAALELEGLDESLDSARQKVDVVGTFNPLAAVSLSSDSFNERTARASEQVAANTKRLVQEAQRGGLVFS
jgi:hypothetical protein